MATTAPTERQTLIKNLKEYKQTFVCGHASGYHLDRLIQELEDEEDTDQSRKNVNPKLKTGV
jgi:hypothetical protein